MSALRSQVIHFASQAPDGLRTALLHLLTARGRQHPVEAIQTKRQMIVYQRLPEVAEPSEPQRMIRKVYQAVQGLVEALQHQGYGCTAPAPPQLMVSCFNSPENLPPSVVTVFNMGSVIQEEDESVLAKAGWQTRSDNTLVYRS